MQNMIHSGTSHNAPIRHASRKSLAAKGCFVLAATIPTKAYNICTAAAPSVKYTAEPRLDEYTRSRRRLDMGLKRARRRREEDRRFNVTSACGIANESPNRLVKCLLRLRHRLFPSLTQDKHRRIPHLRFGCMWAPNASHHDEFPQSFHKNYQGHQ